MPVTPYQPMTLARLGELLASCAESERWLMISEFLEEHRRKPFRRLGERLAYRGIVADLYVFGGAAMALAYDLRRSTRDIDALFTPHGAVLAEAQSVALELELPRWWLNEQASSYVAGGDGAAPLVFDHPGLRVHAASPEHLLAMKVLAGRRRDVGDIRLLAGRLGLQTAAAIRTVVAEVFPDEPIPKRSELLLDELDREGWTARARADAEELAGEDLSDEPDAR